jgi:succinate dehydrogenase/fumarate reductase flavoprotein subunit
VRHDLGMDLTHAAHVHGAPVEGGPWRAIAAGGARPKPRRGRPARRRRRQGGGDRPAIRPETLARAKAEIPASLRRKAGHGPAWVTQTMQGIMIPNFVLYIKEESMLGTALAHVEERRNRQMPMLRAADLHELRLAHETANMIVSAEMKLRAALMRTQSRCSHGRLDRPDVDHVNWRAWITIRTGANGEMLLEKRAVDAWPDQG